MEIQSQAAMSILSMTVQGSHDAVQRANTQQASGAPAADVILELSSAAQALTSSS